MNYPRVIYVIKHNDTNRVYVGRTKNLNRRVQLHLNALRAGKHTVEDMQEDFNNYGENYTITVLEEIKHATEDCGQEYEYMDLYNSRVRGIGYNYKDNHGLSRKKSIYRNAYAEMRRSGLPFKIIFERMNMSYYDLVKKLNGITPITVNEAKRFKKIIGSDLPLEILFKEFEEAK